MRIRAVHIASGDLWAGAEAQIYTLLKSLKELSCEPMAILLNDGELATRLRTEGIAVHICCERQLGFWSLLRSMTKLLIHLKPDVVHTHRQKENILGSIAAWRAKTPVCVRTAHGMTEFQPSLKQRLQALADKMCCRYLQHKVVAVSDEMNERLASQYGTKKVITIYNGVDVERLAAVKASPSIKESNCGAVHIGMIGRIEPVKRVDIFLRTASLLLENRDDTNWRFHVIGDGSHLPQMQSLASKLGIADNVKFYGHRNDAHECMAALDIMVICSDHEGLPMSALERLAMQKCLVAHTVGGLDELLGQQYEGRISANRPDLYAAKDQGTHSIRHY